MLDPPTHYPPPPPTRSPGGGSERWLEPPPPANELLPALPPPVPSPAILYQASGPLSLSIDIHRCILETPCTLLLAEGIRNSKALQQVQLQSSVICKEGVPHAKARCGGRGHALPPPLPARFTGLAHPALGGYPTPPTAHTCLRAGQSFA